jgi:hypothetical protein
LMATITRFGFVVMRPSWHPPRRAHATR